jgi:hypothetical protein
VNLGGYGLRALLSKEPWMTQQYRFPPSSLWKKVGSALRTRVMNAGGGRKQPASPQKERAPSGPPPDKEKPSSEVCKAIRVPEHGAMKVHAEPAKSKGGLKNESVEKGGVRA